MQKSLNNIASSILLVAGIVLMGSVFVGEVDAFTAGAKWASKKANYVFDQAYNQYSPGFHARGQAAIDQWNSIGKTPFRFDPTGEGDNHITIDPSSQVCSKLARTDIIATPTTMSKFTTYVHIGCGYGFYDGTQPYFPSNYYDLETIMRHEFGHALGLCHTHVGSLMQAGLPTGLVRLIDNDAKQGNRFLYKDNYGGPAPEGACFY